MQRNIYIDPSYKVFNSDGLFDLDNSILNRDGQLKPFHRMRASTAGRDIAVHTADFLIKKNHQDLQKGDYYSLGILDSFERILVEKSARLAAFLIMEPPVVAPELYAALPRLAEVFEKIYIYNTNGDGYSLNGVDRSKLYKMYYPIPYNDVLNQYWGNSKRKKRIVIINGCHNPRARSREQYSLRIQAMTDLSNVGVVDLYGKGWNRWWSRSAFWLPYWKNFSALMSIYKGECTSKFEVLQNYEFCLCFENMSMDGYITEKIFDCLYAGTIPLYMGAPDILDYIPEDVFVDCRKYLTWKEMWDDVSTMPANKIESMKIAGRCFLQGDVAKKFYNSIAHICEV